MNEMVERAARAMCIADKRDPDAPAPQAQGEIVVPYWRFYANYALLAISAIREPSRDQLVACLALDDDHMDTDHIWRCMIDAAVAG